MKNFNCGMLGKYFIRREGDLATNLSRFDGRLAAEGGGTKCCTAAAKVGQVMVFGFDYHESFN